MAGQTWKRSAALLIWAASCSKAPADAATTDTDRLLASLEREIASTCRAMSAEAWLCSEMAQLISCTERWVAWADVKSAETES